MGVLDRSLGHPANWIDYAVACDAVADRWLVNLQTEVITELVDGKGVLFTVQTTAYPSAFSPHTGRKPVKKQRQGYVSSGHPLSELMYSCLWEVESVVGIVWPVGVVED